MTAIEDTRDFEAISVGEASRFGRGGMRSKIASARIASESGVPVVICNGIADGSLAAAVAGEEVGTRFAPQRGRTLSPYKLWLKYAKQEAGSLHVDGGAAARLRESGSSLLPVGIVEAAGSFKAGDAVAVLDPENRAGRQGDHRVRQLRGEPDHGPQERLPARALPRRPGRGHPPRPFRPRLAPSYPVGMAATTTTVAESCAAAKQAARALASASTTAKNAALEATARLLEERSAEILDANAADLADERAANLTEALRDRLTLSESRVAAMAEGVRVVAALADPVGEELERKTLASGIDLRKVRVPLGVVAVVYEARPNVTIDCAALTIKSGNAIVLRGSSYAERSNAALAAIAREALAEAGLPADAVLPLAGGGHDDLAELARQEGLVDLLIPRGGEGLKNAIKAVATVPVMYAAAGNCHVYVNAEADLEMARRIVINAKTQRPGVCNAAETLLVDEAIAPRFVPAIALRPRRSRGRAGRRRARPRPRRRRRDRPRQRRRLGRRVPGAEARGRRRRLGRGGGRAHQRPRHRPLGGDRHRIGLRRRRLRRRGRRRRRLRQRLDPLHRRLRVRDGGRDRQLDPEAARPRPDRDARADHVQVRRARQRPGA